MHSSIDGCRCRSHRSTRRNVDGCRRRVGRSNVVMAVNTISAHTPRYHGRHSTLSQHVRLAILAVNASPRPSMPSWHVRCRRRQSTRRNVDGCRRSGCQASPLTAEARTPRCHGCRCRHDTYVVEACVTTSPEQLRRHQRRSQRISVGFT